MSERSTSPRGRPEGSDPPAADPATEPERLAELRRREAQAERGGGDHAIAAQHDKGKLTARERLDLLLDAGSFVELDKLATHRAVGFGLEEQRIPGDGVVTGHGTVAGRRVCVFSHDFTVMGGSLGEVFAEKIGKVMDLAVRMGVPIVGLNDSGGARIQEGVASLGGYGDIFRRNVQASGVVPQISLILGPCAGGAVYSPALTDFVLMARGAARMFVTGPQVVRSVTGEDVSAEDLGGADSHATRSGVAHVTAPDEATCLANARELLGFLPDNNLEEPPAGPPAEDPDREDPALDGFLPERTDQAYDARALVERIVDPGGLYEIHASWGENLVCGFARLDGRPVGVVANDPRHLAGVLDARASEKGARFVRTCDAFNVPLLTLVDVPGFLPGTEQEWGGIIRHGAKLLYAYCEATVPKLTVIVRKAYGGAYDVMGSKHCGADLNLAWPTAEVAVMGPEGAVSVLYRRELEQAEDPQARRAELVDHYHRELANPWRAAERGYVDAVIAPRATRSHLIRGLRLTASKREVPPSRKHGNLPL